MPIGSLDPTQCANRINTLPLCLQYRVLQQRHPISMAKASDCSPANIYSHIKIDHFQRTQGRSTSYSNILDTAMLFCSYKLYF